MCRQGWVGAGGGWAERCKQERVGERGQADADGAKVRAGSGGRRQGRATRSPPHSPAPPCRPADTAATQPNRRQPGVASRAPHWYLRRHRGLLHPGIASATRCPRPSGACRSRCGGDTTQGAAPVPPRASMAASSGSCRSSPALIFMAALAGKHLTLYVLRFSLN